ncbi:site-specific integrase [Aliifodinibius sp. S!AR15-10]|uniref:tyrosine-type recombinase/integrase n=1 Tax=Aliifodinibius sp. S!AR15-10 TaxID=2950437 RepID=UPI002857C5D0|nr:tyrosine-type recombinase/integrase [Aliifodinibius sp. S!AR15-10]MDR8394380.1 site-specific integrase [Aliifodinibius sp. S!AR15-10]
MASLKKRGKYYYIRFSKTLNGKRHRVTKSLGLRYKNKAEEALKQLEELEERGEIDPYSEYFEPQKVLEDLNRKKQPAPVYTVREAADYFYQLKSHLSNKTVRNDDKRRVHKQGAYEQAVEHFIKLNDIADLPIRQVGLFHFEKIIFKPGIKSTTRHFYYRQLRVFWNTLKDRDIVEEDYFKILRKNLPPKKSTVIPKMISDEELMQVFKAFDKEVERKKKLPEFRPYFAQQWFKPLICCYFYGGLRRNEAGYDPELPYSGLKGENLYYEDGELVAIYLGITKGRKERIIPMKTYWREQMVQYLEKRDPVKPDDYVFIYLGGSKKGWPVTGSRAYREFKRYLKEAKLPSSRTLHGMRHERITQWIEDGFNTSEAQYMAGHSSSNVTNRYTHLRAKNLLRKQREIEQRKRSE